METEIISLQRAECKDTSEIKVEKMMRLTSVFTLLYSCLSVQENFCPRSALLTTGGEILKKTTDAQEDPLDLDLYH